MIIGGEFKYHIKLLFDFLEKLYYNLYVMREKISLYAFIVQWQVLLLRKQRMAVRVRLKAPYAQLVEW